MPKKSGSEELSLEQLKQLRTELATIPGVQDVCLETSNPSAILEPNVRAHPDNKFEQEIGKTTYNLEASMIATREASNQARTILRSAHPGIVPLNPVWYINASDWRALTKGIMGRDILDYCLRSDSLLEVAEEPHEKGWRRAKLAAKNDPDNPYQGWGKKELKLKI
jgi:hypothetical protein